MLGAAERIAREAHAGQLYGERDYFEAHIVPVVSVVARMGYGPDFQATAYLHDVMEDGDLTRDWFYQFQAHIPHVVSAAVEILDKRDAPSHLAYMRRIATSPLAVVAKFGDSTVNFAATALLSPDLGDNKYRERINEYAGNIAFLRPLLPPPNQIESL